MPGVDTLILSTCRFFGGLCASAIDWEEAVRFAYVDEAFQEVRDLFVGIAGGLIDEAAKVPEYLGRVFAGVPESGIYRLSLTLDLPPGWNEDIEAALSRAVIAFTQD